MLPILQFPKYTITVPSTRKTIEFRPYRVGEEKILMLAMESEDEKQMINGVKDIIRACTFDKLNPDELTSVDLEYIFLKLRAKSVGETSTVKIKCQNEACGHQVETDINLDTIEPSFGPQASSTITITPTVGLTLKPVTISAMAKLASTGKSKIETVTNLIIASIESIYDEKGVYRAEDHTHEELSAFVDSLSASHLNQIKAYIESLPRLSKDLQFTCPKCKEAQKLTLVGLQSFFA